MLKTHSFSRKRARAVPDISENWVEEYGKFKTWEENLASLKKKGEGSPDMPGRGRGGNPDISQLRLKTSSQLRGLCC